MPSSTQTNASSTQTFYRCFFKPPIFPGEFADCLSLSTSTSPPIPSEKFRKRFAKRFTYGSAFVRPPKMEKNVAHSSTLSIIAAVLAGKQNEHLQSMTRTTKKICKKKPYKKDGVNVVCSGSTLLGRQLVLCATLFGDRSRQHAITRIRSAKRRHIAIAPTLPCRQPLRRTPISTRSHVVATFRLADPTSHLFSL
jgi:hypothetical protein